VTEQVERLVDLGAPELAGLGAARFRELADGLAADGVLCVHPSLVPPSRLAPLLRLGAKNGFVVEDMTDLDDFAPIASVDVPDRPLYLLDGIDRGDEFLGWTPDAALPEILARRRSPLTISEGISWLLQQPDRLEANRCFMCIGSRKVKGTDLDARTPAIWISRGTGRDGAERRDAPKVGWCWAGNHHTWLGCASALARHG
jgi:hypothetical protein